MSNHERILRDTSHSYTSPLSPLYVKSLKPGPKYSGCSATSKIQVEHNDGDSFWTLKTFDGQGNPKKIGGDEFYVTFTLNEEAENNSEDPVTHDIIHHPTYVASSTDMGDGSYRLSFFIPPMSEEQEIVQQDKKGFLTVNLSYTCGIGLVTQKNDWKSKGMLHWQHVEHDLPSPPTKALSIPSLKKKLLDYDYVAAFGDSVMGQFVGQYHDNAKFVKYEQAQGFPSKDKIHFGKNIRMPLYRSNHQKLKAMFKEWHKDHLLEHKDNSAILLGSGPWDLGRITWYGGDESFTIEDTLRGYRTFIEWLRKEYPTVDILWKSQSAVHPHTIPEDADAMVLKGTRYVSTARTLELEKATRQLMKELHVPILDIYIATYLSSDWLYPGDSGHYKSELNQRLLQWFL